MAFDEQVTFIYIRVVVVIDLQQLQGQKCDAPREERPGNVYLELVLNRGYVKG